YIAIMSLSKRSKPNTRYHYHSMDRLNEDCVGVILKYLPLRDKLRLECVSKTWKKKMFIYVRSLTIGSRHICHRVYGPSIGKVLVKESSEKDDEVSQMEVNSDELRMILTKCENVETVVLDRVDYHNGVDYGWVYTM